MLSRPCFPAMLHRYRAGQSPAVRQPFPDRIKRLAGRKRRRKQNPAKAHGRLAAIATHGFFLCTLSEKPAHSAKASFLLAT